MPLVAFFNVAAWGSQAAYGSQRLGAAWQTRDRTLTMTRPDEHDNGLLALTKVSAGAGGGSKRRPRRLGDVLCGPPASFSSAARDMTAPPRAPCFGNFVRDAIFRYEAVVVSACEYRAPRRNQGDEPGAARLLDLDMGTSATMLLSRGGPRPYPS